MTSGKQRHLLKAAYRIQIIVFFSSDHKKGRVLGIRATQGKDMLQSETSIRSQLARVNVRAKLN